MNPLMPNNISVPSFHGPASISAIIMIAGLALMYWSATGLGIISGSNVQERTTSIKEKLTQR